MFKANLRVRMSTGHQLAWQSPKTSKRIRPLVPALKCCPHKRGVIQKLFIQTPKKPNSAKRKVAKVKLSTGRVISCYIPGIGHKFAKHSVVLVRGGRAQDLIGVRYKPVFGKFDCVPPAGRISRLSKYGISNKKFKRANDVAIEEPIVSKKPAVTRTRVRQRRPYLAQKRPSGKIYINTALHFDLHAFLNSRTLKRSSTIK